MSIQDFKSRFVFDSGKVGHIGVEREYFLINSERNIVPRANAAIDYIRSEGWPIELSFNDKRYLDPGTTIGYELSNAQIELRTRPHPSPVSLRSELEWNDRCLTHSLKEIGLSTLHTEVGPEDMPLDVYPDPTGRYQKITENMPRSILLAACRVIGTHVHIGMRDHESALRTYNYVIRHIAELCELGNGSFGERLAIYRQMAPGYEPRPYSSWEHFYEVALAEGFSEDPRKCWTLVRMSVHGTIEFRLFGATDSIDRIMRWSERCHELCQEALVIA